MFYFYLKRMTFSNHYNYLLKNNCILKYIKTKSQVTQEYSLIILLILSYLSLD